MKKIAALFCICFLLTSCTARMEINSGPDTAAAALSDTSMGWGYRPMGTERPEFTAEQTAMMAKYKCIYMGKEDDSLYLTFDEGYENGYTAGILDVLKEKKVPAAFFITGDYLRSEPELVKRMTAEGHIVGNHSDSHPSFPSLASDQAVKKELSALSDSFHALTGQDMHYFRPPKGEYSEKTLFLVNSLGYTNVFWSFAYEDWLTDNIRGADYALEKVTGGLHGGIVLLLHAVSADNAGALGAIIDRARDMGYTFRSLEEYHADV